jgi:hypothetical protein
MAGKRRQSECSTDFQLFLIVEHSTASSAPQKQPEKSRVRLLCCQLVAAATRMRALDGEAEAEAFLHTE